MSIAPVLRIYELNKWRPIFQRIHCIPARHRTCVHYVSQVSASFLPCGTLTAQGYRRLVELSVSLSTVSLSLFLLPHSISSSGNRCWDLLIFVLAVAHRALAVFLTYSVSSTEVLSGQRRRINYTAYIYFKKFIHFAQLTLKPFCSIRWKEFQGFVVSSSICAPCWGASRTNSILNERTVWK